MYHIKHPKVHLSKSLKSLQEKVQKIRSKENKSFSLQFTLCATHTFLCITVTHIPTTNHTNSRRHTHIYTTIVFLQSHHTRKDFTSGKLKIRIRKFLYATPGIPNLFSSFGIHIVYLVSDATTQS